MAPANEMTIRTLIKATLSSLKRRIGWPASALWAWIMASGLRPPAFVGAYPNREAAVAQIPIGIPNSYDHDDIAPLNFDVMCETQIWDYPIMLWLDRLVCPGANILDAGGHFGTKFIAFRDRVDLNSVAWTVYDLPSTIRAALKLQESSVLPEQIKFVHDLTDVTEPDILLASGLLQYLDIEFHELVAKLPQPPKHILLNKVATTEGATVVTLEKIGSGRVPYQIRNRASFERSLSDMGYLIHDSWHIPSLARTIATHPSLGPSTSLGYFLERVK